jgi:hypothetical protein
MEYAKEVDIANHDDEYAIDNDNKNKPLAEGDDNDNNEYASAARCAESFILSVMPAESMILSVHADSIMLLVPPAESLILLAPPAESIARLRPESQRVSVPSRREHALSPFSPPRDCMTRDVLMWGIKGF